MSRPVSAVRTAWAPTLLVLVLLAVTAPEARAQWITPVWGDTYSFRAQGGEAVLRIPMTLDPDSAAVLQGFELVGARAGSVHDEALSDAIVPTLDDGPVPAAVLTLDLSVLNRPDTVDLLLRALREEGPPRDLALHLVRPAAALRDPGTVRIERVAAWPGGDRMPPLVLVETSGRSGLHGLDLRSLPFTTEGDRPADVEVVARFPADSALPPSGHRRVPYTLTGSVPLGTSTGIVLLTAPQLPGPVPVTFEIHKRLSLWVLAGLIFAGLLVGFVMRIWLERKKELARARDQAVEMIGRLRRARERYADATFQGVVEGRIETLEGSLRTDVAQDLTTEVEAAQAALTGALEALKERLETQEVRREALGLLVGTPWWLPSAMDRLLASAGSELNDAKSRLEAGDATGAKTRLDTIETELGAGLMDAVTSWRPELGHAYEAILEGRARLPKQVREGAKPGLEALRTTLEEIPQPAAGQGAPDEVRPTLEGVDKHRRRGREVLQRLLLGIRGVEARTRDILEPLPDPGAWGPVTESLTRLESAAAPDAELEETVAVFTDATIWDAWRGAIRAQAPAPPDGLDDALEEGDYREAARLIDEARKREADEVPLGRAAGAGTAPGRDDGVVGSLSMGLDALFDVLSPRGGTAPGVAALPPVGSPGALAALRARSRGEIVTANAVQFVVSALLLTVIGLTILADSFTGTLPDLVTAFFWGFTLDIAVGTVTEQVGRLTQGS